jgi:hypothetical protein
MQRARAVAHVSLWLVLLTAFLCVSGPKVFRRAPKGSVTLVGGTSFHSSDSFLRFSAGLSDASKRLIAFFDLTPSGKRILILDRGDDSASSLLAMLTAYLAWPHPVEIVDLAQTRANRGVVAALDVSPPAAIVLCRVRRPVELPEGKHFGGGLEIVPIAMSKP